MAKLRNPMQVNVSVLIEDLQLVVSVYKTFHVLLKRKFQNKAQCTPKIIEVMELSCMIPI